MPRRCSSRPLTASVGPLLEPVVEEDEDIVAPFGQGTAELRDLDQGGGHGFAERINQRHHRRLAPSAAGGSVGGDHGLVGTPGDLDVLVVGERFV